MIHHLLPASPYSRRFLELLAAHPREFPPEEHRFWLEAPRDPTFRVADAGGLRCERVGPWGFVRAFRALGPGDRVVIHQLSDPRLLLYLACFRGARRRCIWSIWGGDVYYDRFRPRTWAHSLRERLRRRVIPGIPLVSSMIPGDFETVRSVYGSRARYVRAFYPIPMDTGRLTPRAVPDPSSTGARSGRPVTLLVGNSGDPSNAHAEVFRALARFRGERLRVVAPLSYGDPAYVAAVVEDGRRCFGDSFVPLTDFLPPEQYARWLEDTDAAVMNHGFQQALGSIIALLLLGKKVFVRSDTTPYRYFHDLGVTVHDTLRLPALSLAELVESGPGTGLRNAAAVRAHLSEENAVAGWRTLFEAARGPAGE